MRVAKLSFLAICFSLLWSPVVNAEDYMETIVVTAQKRSEDLQDVPISMEVISGDALEQMRVKTFEDLQNYVPNFTVQPTPGANQIYIRGIGSGAQNFAFEQAVSLYVDGVYAGRNRQFMSPFFDIERIEVLRGPQGSLLGKNTAAGAVSLVSARPTDKFEGYIDTSFLLDRDGYDLSAVISGPLSDRVNGRLSMMFTDADGYIDNDGTNEEVPSRDDKLMRGTLTFAPNDSTTITTKLEYSDVEVGGTQSISELPLSSFSDGEKFTEDPFGRPQRDNTESWNAIVEIETSLGENTLTALTGYSTFDATKFTGAASADPEDWLSIQREDFDQISQEIRLSSPVGRDFEWIVGVYIDDSDYTTEFDTEFFLFGGFFAGHTNMIFEQDTTTWSGFAQGVWNLTDKLTLIASARYTDTSKDAELNQFVISGAALPGNGVLPKRLDDSLDENNFDPAITAKYQFSPDTMMYLTFAQGSKAGGFVSNSGSVSATTFNFDSEESHNIEWGIKSTILDGRATTALSIFHTEFDDLQVSNFVPGDGLIIGNAASATSEGAEFTADWQISEGLRLGTSIAYLEAKYDDFPGGPCIFGRPCPENPADNDIGGTTIPSTSKWSGNIRGEYQVSVFGDMVLTTSVIAHYRSSYEVEANLNPDSRQDGYTKLDARIELASGDKKWSVALLGRNLTDKDTFNFSYFWPFGPVAHRIKYLEETRTVQLQARYHF